jgi:hypothetical protein
MARIRRPGWVREWQGAFKVWALIVKSPNCMVSLGRQTSTTHYPSLKSPPGKATLVDIDPAEATAISSRAGLARVEAASVEPIASGGNAFDVAVAMALSWAAATHG